MTTAPIITLLTDFGLADHYVAAMKGVILGINPEIRLVDISHEIKPYAVGDAAFTLSQAYPCFPAGTIHLVVVDPGVGSARRPLLVEADGHLFIGPDNGVLTFPIDRDQSARVLHITAESRFRQPVSNTFHGRDVFAPTAAHLAADIEPQEFGDPISDPVRLNLGHPVQLEPAVWQSTILHIDRYGNLVTGFRTSDVPGIAGQRFEMKLGDTIVRHYRDAYAGASRGVPFVIEGSSGYLEISVNQGSAALDAKVELGSKITLQITL
jgi:S-adenosylmethionine hydrolase